MNSIPHVIHYCWFGRNPLPEAAKKCIASWKKYCSDYEIIEWNEDNFDLHICPYVEEAYQAKKWAFVSDYARFWILYHYGGLYFDTDVEIIKPLDQIVETGPFMGLEAGNDLVAPGLGLGVNKENEIYKEILDFYSTAHFLNADGTVNETTVVTYTSDVLRKHGWKKGMGTVNPVDIDGIHIYPTDYFCPQCYQTGKTTITDRTVSIHHYSMSWKSPLDIIVKRIETYDDKNSLEYRVRHCISFPFRVASKIQKLGWTGTARFIGNKLRK